VTVGSGFVAVADCAVGAGGTVVGLTVGDKLAGAETVTLGIAGTPVGSGVDGGAEAQAVTKAAARISAVVFDKKRTRSSLPLLKMLILLTTNNL